jgi:hypothetical protein
MTMEELDMTDAVFRRYRDHFNTFNGYAQNAEALVSLVVQASGPVCNIATPPLENEERQRVFALLYEREVNGWSVQVGTSIMVRDGMKIHYQTYSVRNIKPAQLAERSIA